jgi:hypothetical protein
MTSDELLTAARIVLRDPAVAPSGWPRMVALLTRQALETALEEFWASHQVTAGLSRCTHRTQLVCLPFYLDGGVARKVGYTWAALSEACHYHAYELAPTAGELSGWLDAVADLIESMEGPA